VAKDSLNAFSEGNAIASASSGGGSRVNRRGMKKPTPVQQPMCSGEEISTHSRSHIANSGRKVSNFWRELLRRKLPCARRGSFPTDFSN
jgi:hypothetical protein